MKSIRVYFGTIVLLFFCLTLFPVISLAHAYIVKSSPIENESLKKSPSDVTIQFDESIQPKFTSIKVTDSYGKQVDQKNGGIDSENPSVLKVGIKKNLPDGIYRIHWKVLSNDGHPVSGVIPFQVGSTSANDASKLKNDTESYTAKTDLVIIRWLQYIGNSCFVGLLFFYLLIADGVVEKRIFRYIWGGYLLIFLSIILSLPLQATIVLGEKWSEVFSYDAFEQVLAYTAFGKVWLIQMALLLTLALTTHFISLASSTKKLISWISLGLGFGLLLTKAFTSHASGQTNRSLMIAMDFLHLSAATLWIGCLIGLVIVLPLLKNKETKNIYVQMVRRFTRYGLVFVLLLAITGIYEGIQYIPSVYALLKTGYGKVLIAKIGLFLIMLIFAAINLIKGKQSVTRGLKASISSELLTGVLVLVLTIFLTNLPPAIASPGPFKETNTGDQGFSVTFEVTPNIIGVNEYRILLKDKDGKPINHIEQMTLTFEHTEMDMGKDTVTLEKMKEGIYQAKGLNLNMAGKWIVHVHALTKELDSIDTDFTWIVGSR